MLVAGLIPSLSAAQPAPGSLDLAAVVGSVGFIDEVTDYRVVVGGSVRVHLPSRWAVEPELLYIRHPARRHDIVLQGNLVRFLVGTDEVQPYVVGGLGILHTRERFPGAVDPFASSTGLTASGGAGLRLRVGARLVVRPEFRLGFEPLTRATVAVGSTLGR